MVASWVVDDDGDINLERRRGSRQAFSCRRKRKRCPTAAIIVETGTAAISTDRDYDSAAEGEPTAENDWRLNSASDHRPFGLPYLLVPDALDFGELAGADAASRALISAVEGPTVGLSHLSNECDAGGAWRREMCALDPIRGPVSTNCAGASGDGARTRTGDETDGSGIWQALYGSIGRLVRRTHAMAAAATAAAVDDTNPRHLWPSLGISSSTPEASAIVTAAQYCRYSSGGHFGRWHLDEVTGHTHVYVPAYTHTDAGAYVRAYAHV